MVPQVKSEASLKDETSNNNNHNDTKSGHQYEHSWEPEIAEKIKLALRERVKSGNVPHEKQPYMVALVGIPGGGKSISSLLLANFLENFEEVVPDNDSNGEDGKTRTKVSSLGVMIMPHDGYHYPMDQLRLFPNANDAIYRRGAPDTFDPAALKRDLERIRYGYEEELITVPGFDHGRGDPEPDQHAFDRNNHKVVICEGLYLLHDSDGWEEIASMFDLTIFIESDVDACVERLKIRNLCIPGYTPEQIELRCEEVDRVNANTVMKSKYRAMEVVQSLVSKQKKGKHQRIPSAASFASLDLATHEPHTTDYIGITSHGQNHHPGHGISHGHSHAGHHARRLSHQRSESGTDWMMTISHRPRSDSMGSFSDIGSAFGGQTEVTTEPAPASAFVGSWEAQMAKTIADDMKKKPNNRPYMVALVGTPGSGKSISALLLANNLETNNPKSRVMVMPHDGYHYTLEYLRTFPNAEDFIYRRGAPDTFDPAALKRDLERIRFGKEELITLPAFDHSRGDPEPDTHAFDRNRHDIVICEGLYLLHDKDGWEGIADCFDYKIFMNSDIELCMERVKIRNQCIPGYTPEEIAERTERVDRINSLMVLTSKSRADIIVDSLAMTSRTHENSNFGPPKEVPMPDIMGMAAMSLAASQYDDDFENDDGDLGLDFMAEGDNNAVHPLLQ